jgi:hypothetical protein
MAELLNAQTKGPAAGHGYEPSDISVKTIALILLAFAIVAGVSVGLVLWLHPLMEREALRSTGPTTAIETTQLPAPPIELQAQPLIDIAALHQREDAVLDHYGWVDKAKGIAHIPIDEAMKQVVGQSLDTPP